MSEAVSLRAGAASFSPLRLHERSLVFRIAAVVFGSALLAVSSYIVVPTFPVPVTMQTFAITLISALYGWRLGASTIVVWLLLGAIGLPVFANGAFGLAYIAGPTGGYLLAFPVAAALMGYLAERGWNGQHPWLAFAAAMIAEVVCLTIGALWLSTLIGFEKALLVGVLPFLTGSMLKAGLTAATLAVIVWLIPPKMPA
ncbi:biotin transporter BioY [Pseudochelatococcus sp. G4_1912]|uniref:biotin transporter BioY n=1 Tax=Pseudochelatococcus sp. G4_1912 TaxID=3114288 RepID=UPI0039C63AFB